MGALYPPTPVAQERSPATDLETMLLNWLPVGTVTEGDAASPDPSVDSARISDDYRPQLPVVGKDIPGQAVPCHEGTARLLETVNIQTRSVGCAVCHPYSDSDESDNDVLYADEHDSTVQQVSLRNNSLRPTHVVRGVHSWTISIGFCRPMSGPETYLPRSRR